MRQTVVGELPYSTHAIPEFDATFGGNVFSHCDYSARAVDLEAWLRREVYEGNAVETYTIVGTGSHKRTNHLCVDGIQAHVFCFDDHAIICNGRHWKVISDGKVKFVVGNDGALNFR
jgi:hypothetical protein